MTLNRRQMIRTTGAAVLGAGTLGWSRLRADDASGDTKKVLFFTKSAGFQHSVVTRRGDQLSLAERVMTQIGQTEHIEVVASKDGRLFEPDVIDQWDGFAFYTTGDLTQPGTDGQPPMSPEGKQAFLQAIEQGKGFVGMHSATDTFHGQGDQVDPFIRMIGGEFTSHGAQQVARLIIIDPEFPGAQAFGTEAFEINDEWYAQKNLADDLHVIYAHDTEGMQGAMYHRPPYPQTWARRHGRGPVFYTSMGHREDVWADPRYQELLIGGLRWALGMDDYEIKPNVKEVTPGYDQVVG